MNPELIACLTVGVLSPVVVISVLTICATLVALFATGERAVRAHAVLMYLLDALRARFMCGGGKR